MHLVETPRPLSHGQRVAAAIRLLRGSDCVTYAQAARTYDLAPGTVRRNALIAGIVRTRATGNAAKRAQERELRLGRRADARIAADYAAGLTVRAIAERYGIERNTVVSVAQRAGCVMRGRNGRRYASAQQQRRSRWVAEHAPAFWAARAAGASVRAAARPIAEALGYSVRHVERTLSRTEPLALAA
jgi:transposase